MLSSVLRSPTAVAVNIEIMRAFVQLRRALADSRELADRFAALERRLGSRLDGHDEVIAKILEAIRGLMFPDQPTRRPIGFVTDEGKSSRQAGLHRPASAAIRVSGGHHPLRPTGRAPPARAGARAGCRHP